MGVPRKAVQKAMLLVGALYCDAAYLEKAEKALASEFGKIFYETGPGDWHSEYYRDELGWPIKRVFLFFDILIDPGLLADIKLLTNRLEADFFSGPGSRRMINLDPGYITPAKLVLASTKDYSHRVYLGKGIFAEVTLMYSARKKTFVPHTYTYRDFKDAANVLAFNEMRQALMERLGLSGKGKREVRHVS
ncbi:MAG: DUF4416 family protein [Nitrospiraceae bacterium]|nr:DUF4416 family protein [Nitrospiraceae bacterium]